MGVRAIKHRDGTTEFFFDTVQEAAHWNALTSAAPAADIPVQFSSAVDSSIKAPEFISMLQRRFSGQTIESQRIADLLGMGVQGVGPFMGRIERELESEGLKLNEYVLKASILGKPTTWKILTDQDRKKVS